MEKINLVSKKNKFINQKNKGKIKILTAGKKYILEKEEIKYFVKNYRYRIDLDNRESYSYSESEVKENFITLNNSRNIKLNELGI